MVVTLLHSTSFTEECPRLIIAHACHFVTFLKTSSTNVVKCLFADDIDIRHSVKVELELYAVNVNFHLHLAIRLRYLAHSTYVCEDDLTMRLERRLRMGSHWRSRCLLRLHLLHWF